jgi:SAM-dependent methyltransferase
VSYADYHAPRFRYLLALIDRYAPSGALLLDVGLSPFTDRLRRHVGRPVDSIGLERDEGAPSGRHFHVDLNRVEHASCAVPRRHYGAIVFAEVLEHLHAAPGPVLRFLGDRLDAGGVLILQTPNAASLPKRLKLLVGTQPYEMLRGDARNPGHVREYTLRELTELAAANGFAAAMVDRRYYFDARFADVREDGSGGRSRPIAGTVKNVVYRALPPPLREGITLVLRPVRTA